MLGFNFYEPSPRYIETGVCREIIDRVKEEFPDVVTVGVFVNHSVDQINEVIEVARLDYAQLSGDEPISMIHQLGNKAFKAVRASTIEAAQEIIDRLPERESAPAFLIDSHQKGSYGGTGITGNWELAADIAKKYPVLLAGGLNIKNIGEAIRTVQPWGVDVASGVESERGVKDPQKIIAFIDKTRAAAEQISV